MTLLGVLEVAGDLVELGREDEAKRLLDEQAPNRLDRWCSSCGAMIGEPCDDWQVGTERPKLIVPHLSRIDGPPHLMERIDKMLDKHDADRLARGGVK